MSAQTYQAAVDRYLYHLRAERGLAALTLEGYAGELGRFGAFLGDAAVAVDQLGRDSVLEYLSGMMTRECEARTRRRSLAAIRGLFRFLLEREVLSDDPTSIIESPGSPTPLPTAVGVADIELLLASPDRTTRAGCHDAAMLELLVADQLAIYRFRHAPASSDDDEG